MASGSEAFRVGRGIELTPEHPVSEVVGLAKLAENEGFDTAFASSHWFNRDAFVTLAAIVGATEEIRVGPGVTNPYGSHPAVLAARMGTLHELSGGRGVFGVGAGDRSALSALGIDRDRPLRRVLETVRVARTLWRGERVDHDGTFVARDAELNFAPGEIPVYVGAQGPGMLRMAGKHADGVLVNASHPDDLAWAAARVAEGVTERDEGEPEVAAYASVSVAEDAEEAREAARPPVAFIVGGAAPEALERHGLDAERAARIGTLLGGGRLREAFDEVSGAMIDAFCVAGTVDDVTARFDAALEHADGIVAAAPLGPDRREAVGLLAEAFSRLRG